MPETYASLERRLKRLLLENADLKAEVERLRGVLAEIARTTTVIEGAYGPQRECISVLTGLQMAGLACDALAPKKEDDYPEPFDGCTSNIELLLAENADLKAKVESERNIKEAEKKILIEEVRSNADLKAEVARQTNLIEKQSYELNRIYMGGTVADLKAEVEKAVVLLQSFEEQVADYKYDWDSFQAGLRKLKALTQTKDAGVDAVVTPKGPKPAGYPGYKPEQVQQFEKDISKEKTND